MDELDKKFYEELKQLEDLGCSCDAMYGFSCSIHTHIFRLKKLWDERKSLIDKS